MTRRSVAVEISGKKYGVVSDADEGFLQRVGAYVDDSMAESLQEVGRIRSH